MAYTLSFSEKSKGWVSFKSFNQENGISLNNSYYTFSGGNMYQHHINETRNEFYGNQFDSSVDLLFNQGPGIIKSFSTLNYEGSQAKVTPEINNNPDYYDNFPKDGWYVKEMISNAQELGEMEFWDKEDKWFSQIKGVKTCWLNDGTAGNIDPQEFSYQGIGNAYGVSCPDCPSIITWECVAGASSYSCEEISGLGGSFAQEIDCLNCASCNCNVPSVSFDCVNGSCIDDGLGNGPYATHCDCVNSEGCCDEGAALTYTCQNITAPGTLVYGCMDDGVTPDPFITQQRPSGWIGSATNYDPNANVPDCSCIYQTLSTWDCETTTGTPDTYQYNNCDDPTLITVSPNGELDFNGNPQYDMWTVWSHALTIFSDPTYNLQNTNFEQVLFCVDNTYGACTTNDCCPCNNGLGHLQGIMEIIYQYDLFTGTNVWPSITPGVYGNLTMGAGLPQNYSSLVSNWQQFDPSITLGMTFLEIVNSLNAVANANPGVSTGNAYRRDTLGRVCQCTGLIPGTLGSTDCIEIFDGTGEFSSYDDCEDDCVVPSWDCDSPGVCVDPETGQGQYTSEAACLAGCPAPISGCTDPFANNYDPLATIDDGSCEYSTSESWDCDGRYGNCYDPGTGNGQYTTLLACQSDPLSNCCIPSLNMNSQCDDNYNQWVAQGSNVYSITGTYYPGRVVSFIDPAIGIVNYFMASAASGTILGASSSSPQLYPEPTAANLWAPLPGNDKGSWEGCEVVKCNESWNCDDGNCIDPGTGQGTYTTLGACMQSPGCGGTTTITPFACEYFAFPGGGYVYDQAAGTLSVTYNLSHTNPGPPNSPTPPQPQFAWQPGDDAFWHVNSYPPASYGDIIPNQNITTGSGTINVTGLPTTPGDAFEFRLTHGGNASNPNWMSCVIPLNL